MPIFLAVEERSCSIQIPVVSNISIGQGSFQPDYMPCHTIVNATWELGTGRGCYVTPRRYPAVPDSTDFPFTMSHFVWEILSHAHHTSDEGRGGGEGAVRMMVRCQRENFPCVADDGGRPVIQCH